MTILLILFATGLLAGTVDAIAGGGGLISLPVLLSLGVPAHMAFGTNKLQAIFGTVIAARRYYRQGWLCLEKSYRGLLSGLLGAVGGAVAAQVLSGAILQKIIPFLLLLVLLYSIYSPRIGKDDHPPRLTEAWFYIVFGFALGFYDGFFGPGVGSFWVFSLTFFLGYNLLKATAYTKLFNLNSNVVAVICFMLGGNVNYKMALFMAAGQLLGGYLGASFAIKKGANLIRPVFLSMVSMTILTLIYRNYAGSGLFVHYLQNHLLLLTMLVVGILSFASILFHRKMTLNKAN